MQLQHPNLWDSNNLKNLRSQLIVVHTIHPESLMKSCIESSTLSRFLVYTTIQNPWSSGPPGDQWSTGCILTNMFPTSFDNRWSKFNVKHTNELENLISMPFINITYTLPMNYLRGNYGKGLRAPFGPPSRSLGPPRRPFGPPRRSFGSPRRPQALQGAP